MRASADRYLELRCVLRQTLAQKRKWTELPGLLDELDRARRQGWTEDWEATPGTNREALWIDQFAHALQACAPVAVAREQARGTARAVWPWMHDQDPVSVALGRWDDLPRSYA
jgi:DNA-binding IclR family transcriptional regulator